MLGQKKTRVGRAAAYQTYEERCNKHKQYLGELSASILKIDEVDEKIKVGQCCTYLHAAIKVGSDLVNVFPFLKYLSDTDFKSEAVKIQAQNCLFCYTNDFVHKDEVTKTSIRNRINPTLWDICCRHIQAAFLSRNENEFITYVSLLDGCIELCSNAICDELNQLLVSLEYYATHAIEPEHRSLCDKMLVKCCAFSSTTKEMLSMIFSFMKEHPRVYQKVGCLTKVADLDNQTRQQLMEIFEADGKPQQIDDMIVVSLDAIDPKSFKCS